MKAAVAAEEEAPHPTYLDFGDILVQKAMAAAEAVGMAPERRSMMVSPEAGITEEKKKMMLANHTVAKKCAYVCAGDNLPSPKKAHDAKALADGCGKPGLKVNADFPFESCCHQHDVCYGSCNKHKNQCDLEFIGCMNNTCNTIAPNNECRHAAVDLFDDTVTLAQDSACESYLGSQKKACDCTSRTKVTKDDL